MVRATLGVVIAAICVPVMAGTIGASPVGRENQRIFVQIEPAGSAGRSAGAVSVRAEGGAAGDVEFDPPSSPRGACSSASGSDNSNGVCADSLPWTGGGNQPGGNGSPLGPGGNGSPQGPGGNNGNGGGGSDPWSDAAPGMSDEDFVNSGGGGSTGGLPDDEDGRVREPRIPRDDGDIAHAPEAATILMMGGGLLALGYFQKKRLIG